MRVLNGPADLNEKLQSRLGIQLVLVAITGDGNTFDQFHYEVGRPVSVAPASSTLAMFGWSISANAWRSASNRAMTCRVSIPSLITLSATRRRTGCSCSAT